MKLLKFHLTRAQNRMKLYADKHRVDRQFKVGEFVYLKLQPYRQTTVANRINMKLSAKYYGPYEILQKIGKVAYKLKLPDYARVHPVFHVSQLKKHVGTTTTQTELPILDDDGLIPNEPIAILGRRMIKRNNVAETEVLVQWKNCFPEDATWEQFSSLQEKFPAFNL